MNFRLPLSQTSRTLPSHVQRHLKADLVRGSRVGDIEHKTIDGKYIADIMSKDVGIDCTITLGRIRKGLERYKNLFTAQYNQSIPGPIIRLEQMIETALKILKYVLHMFTPSMMELPSNDLLLSCWK